MSGMLAAALLLAWIPILSAQTDRPAKQYSLSIPRGPLASALDYFSKQTGLQIGAEYRTAEERELVVGPVIGDVTAEDALSQLLAESDLDFAWSDEYTIRVYATVITSVAEENVAEVVVTGTRLTGGESPAPIRVLGHKRIGRFGVSTISNAARYITQQPFSFSDAHQQSGAQYFQMRGLGFDTTLVLINGRRTSPSANSIFLNAFDLNTIPLTAVDRIEMMSDSASAIYGADAIGGVVNIILKQEIKQPEVFLHYGGADGGSTERRFAASIGSSSKRLTSALTLDYFEHDPLIGDDRDLWRNQDFRRFGSQDYRVSTANPGNVYSITGLPLPGLPSSQAAIPAGNSGVGLTSADFLPTAGLRSLESPYHYRAISSDWDRASAFGFFEFQATPGLSVFGEMLIADSSLSTQRGLPTLSRALVPATNPFNPFRQPVAVDYMFTGMAPVTQENSSDLIRVVSGLRGSFNKWSWEIAALRSEDDVTVDTINNIDPVRVRAALAATDPSVALNLFRDGPAGSGELLRSLVVDQPEIKSSSESMQVAAFVRGPLFALPAGKSEFVVGGEWRRDGVDFFEQGHVSRAREISAAFAEIKLPLLDELSLKLALRSDHYEDIGDSLNPQYGLIWRPTQDWLLRISYGTSFRPPSLFELHTPLAEVFVPIADPRRGGAVSTVRITAAGNPDLEVVTARSLTTGFVYTPVALPGMRLTSSYWRIVMDNRIMVPPVFQVVAIEDLFPERVIRSAATPEDISVGRPGAIQSLNISRLNHGRLETSGIDVDVSYLVETDYGCFTPTLTATWVDEYSAQDLNAVLPVDRVGIANVQGTIPEWRVVGTLAWKLGSVGASATATYTPSYGDSNQSGPTDRRLPSRTLMDLQGWLDLGKLLDERSIFSQTRLTIGMLNLFDESPDFAEAGFVLGYDASQAEMTQRFAYLRLSKSF